MGRREDTRECVRGNCLNPLRRTVDCRLPNECAGNEACEREKLICSENAECVKFSTELSHHCECLPGFEGNGTTCEGSSGVRGVASVAVMKLLLMLYFLVYNG